MAKTPRLVLVNDDADIQIAGRRNRKGPERQRPASRRQAPAAPQGSYSRDLKPKSAAQARLIDIVDTCDLTFAVGPAGTGKTHIAVRKAVEALKAGKVKRIVLSRPAVEAGERLGFLPGGPEEKLEPYMRPLYDELMTCVPPQQIKAWMAERILEVAPIGFMRGRTFSDCFVVVDEAQNLTAGQIKMAVTRMGYGSKMVVTGDPEQSDLDEGDSGLAAVVAQVEGRAVRVGVARLEAVDVVRHPVVRAMLDLLAA